MKGFVSDLVLHGLFLTDKLRAQDEHLFLPHLQLLVGGVQLIQQDSVRRRTRSSGTGLSAASQRLTHLIQMMFELLILRLQLLTLKRIQNYQHAKTFIHVKKKHNITI